jgi:Secretion system C-terminal sorting domain
MKRYLFFYLLLLNSSLFAQPEFQQTYNIEGLKAQPYDIQQTMDRGYVVVGFVEDTSGNQDMLVLKLDSIGGLIWQRQFGGLADEIAQASMEDEFGNIYVTGYSYEYGGADIVYLKFDSDGNTIWQRIIGDSNSEHGWDILYDADSVNILIWGYSYSVGPGITNCVLMKISPDGDTLLTKTYGGDYRDYGHSIKRIDNGYVLCGHSSSFSDTTLGYENHDAYIVKMDSNYEVVWANAYGIAGREEGNAVAVTQEGDYVFVGESDGFGNNHDMMVMKLNASGDTLWGRIIGTPYDDQALDVVINSENEIIVAGHTTSELTGRDISIIKLDQNGETIQTYTLASSANEGLFGVTNTVDGNFAVTGYMYGFEPLINKFFAAKINSTTTSTCIDTALFFFNVRKEFRIGPGTITENAELHFTTHPSSPFIPTVISNKVCGFSEIDESELIRNDVNIYPNPVDDIMYVESESCISISILNSMGQVIYQNQNPSENLIINMAPFSEGLYLIYSEFDDNVITKKLIKQ